VIYHRGVPERLEQLITLGREHYQAGEYDRAEKYLAEVVEIRPTFPDVFNMLGVIYHGSGRFQEAEEAFENALQLNPNYTDAALNLSVTYNDRGKYEKAREIYARVMSNSVGQPRGLDPFARGKLANMHADLGEAYGSLGMHDEAVREYSKALDLSPEFADLRVRLGNVFRDMGHYNSAIAEFEHAKRLKPEYLPARINLGVTLFSLGRKDEAIREWEQVLEADPGNKSATLYLRMIKDEHAPRAGSALGRSE
jgi:tetratricopeptide (TPR) repeat protein